jgi:hypothetical protein
MGKTNSSDSDGARGDDVKKASVKKRPDPSSCEKDLNSVQVLEKVLNNQNIEYPLLPSPSQSLCL